MDRRDNKYAIQEASLQKKYATQASSLQKKYEGSPKNKYVIQAASLQKKNAQTNQPSSSQQFHCATANQSLFPKDKCTTTNQSLYSQPDKYASSSSDESDIVHYYGSDDPGEFNYDYGLMQVQVDKMFERKKIE